MTLTIEHGRINVRKPGETSVSATIPGKDISSIEITQRIQEWKDDTRLEYYNDKGDYTNDITSGDKLSVVLTISTGGRVTSDPARFGEVRFGESTFGGQILPISHNWRGWARSPTYEEQGAAQVLATVEASDFVFETLSQRLPFEEFTDRQIAGSEDAIVETLLKNYAPEIDRSAIEPVPENITFSVYGDNLLSTMQELATQANALLASQGDKLIFRPVEKIKPAFKLQPEDYGTAKLDIDDSNLKNHVRVDGAETPGEDQVTAEGKEDIVDYKLVNDTEWITMPLNPEKNRIMYADLWTRGIPDSEDSIRVRIQRSSATSDGPVSPGDDRKDIDHGNTGVAISDEGWRDKIRLSKEPLPENPWLIIDATGSTGQYIGVVDEDNTPAIRTYYPHKILRTVSDGQSINEYRRREIRLKKKDVASNYQTASRIADSHLRHNRIPEKKLNIDAQSVRTHTLVPGEIVQVEKEELGATGRYIVVERSDMYSADNNNLETDLTLQELRSI